VNNSISLLPNIVNNSTKTKLTCHRAQRPSLRSISNLVPHSTTFSHSTCRSKGIIDSKLLNGSIKYGNRDDVNGFFYLSIQKMIAASRGEKPKKVLCFGKQDHPPYAIIDPFQVWSILTIPYD
jgi:hypothetical protein